MSRFLITGGSGFIGTHLVERLLACGEAVCNLDLRAPNLQEQRPYWRQVDILDANGLTTAVRQFEPDFVVHLAARTDMHGGSLEAYAPNIQGVANMIAAAAATPSLQRIVFASSRLVCRIGYRPSSPTDWQPTTPYGESKVHGERLLRTANSLSCEWAIVRPTSIWGPWFKVPYRGFFDAIRHGRYVHPKGAQVEKSFGYVGNTAWQLHRLCTTESAAVLGGLFYLADYQPIEVRTWGESIRASFGAPPIREVPMSGMRLLARVGDGLSALGWKDVPLTTFRLDNLLTPMLHDTDNLQAVCGELPFKTMEGVHATTGWMSRAH